MEKILWMWIILFWDWHLFVLWRRGKWWTCKYTC